METKHVKSKFVKICVRLYSFFEKNWQLGFFIFLVLFWGPFFWNGKTLRNDAVSFGRFFKAWLPSLTCWALTFLICWVNHNHRLKEYKKKHKDTKKHDYVYDYNHFQVGSPCEYWRAIDDLKNNIIISSTMFFLMVICITLLICPI